MPVLSKGSLRIDYTDDGQGQPVVLIHGSVSANRQWRALIEALKDRYRVLTVVREHSWSHGRCVITSSASARWVISHRA